MTSKVVQVAAVNRFAAPATITKSSTLSSQTSIHVNWSAVTPGVSPGGDVLGYKLRVEDAINGTSWIAFDGQELGQPLRLSHTIYGLTTGRDYLISVAAISVNGDGEWYDPAIRFHSCIAPSQADAPNRVTSTINSITISWEEPI